MLEFEWILLKMVSKLSAKKGNQLIYFLMYLDQVPFLHDELIQDQLLLKFLIG